MRYVFDFLYRNTILIIMRTTIRFIINMFKFSFSRTIITKIKQSNMMDENFSKLHGLIEAWEGKENQRIPADVITEMFNVHNQIFPNNREYSKSCGGCRQRVWNRLKGHYYANKQSYGL